MSSVQGSAALADSADCFQGLLFSGTNCSDSCLYVLSTSMGTFWSVPTEALIILMAGNRFLWDSLCWYRDFQQFTLFFLFLCFSSGAETLRFLTGFLRSALYSYLLMKPSRWFCAPFIQPLTGLLLTCSKRLFWLMITVIMVRSLGSFVFLLFFFPLFFPPWGCIIHENPQILCSCWHSKCRPCIFYLLHPTFFVHSVSLGCLQICASGAR